MVEENTGVKVALGADSTEDQQEAPGSYHGLVARVESLEDLSRLTLARSCHQLYTRGIRQEIHTCSLVQISRDTVLSLVDSYFAGAIATYGIISGSARKESIILRP